MESSAAVAVVVVSEDVAVVVVGVVSEGVVVAAVVIALCTVDNLRDVSNQCKRPLKTKLLKFFVSKVLLIKSIKPPDHVLKVGRNINFKVNL